MSKQKIEQQRIISAKAIEPNNVGLRHLCIELVDVILENVWSNWPDNERLKKKKNTDMNWPIQH